MKRTLVLLMVVGLIAGSIGAAEAGKKKKKKKPAGPVKVERTYEFTYMCPCVGLFQLGGLHESNVGGGPITIGAEEAYLTATATDTTGQVVPVDINQDTNGDGANDAVGSFCGETAAPMPISPGLEVRVFVGLPITCPSPAVLAGGTITFTFSNLP